MKKIFCLLFLLTALMGKSQITETLSGNAVWADDNHRDWCDKGLGTCLLNYNGILMAFNYQGNGTRKGGHAYMYQINEAHSTSPDHHMDDYAVGPTGDHNNKLEFRFPGEGSSYDEGAVLGRTFTFLFNGTAWYFMHIRSAYYESDHDWEPVNESYECFAELPGTTDQKCFTYYTTTSPASTKWKQGAFQIDSLLYFITWDGSKQIIQEYAYDAQSNKFSGTGNVIQTGNNLHRYVGNVITRMDSTGGQYALATFYDQLGKVQFIKIIPGVSNNKRTFTYESLGGTGDSPFTLAKIGASCISQGSMRGSRDASAQTYKSSSDRVFLFGEELSPNSDGSFHLQYLEYRVEKENYILHAQGTLAVPSSYGPMLVSGNYHLLTSYELFPMEYTGEHPGYDGFKQYVWVIYPDCNRHFHGVMFESDQWRYLMGSKVESADLGNDDPETGYEGISSLWSLVAILDGPPPVAIDWEKWDETFPDPTPPTSITLMSKEGHKTEFNNTTANEWNIGVKVAPTTVKKHSTKGCSSQMKYSYEYETQYGTAYEKVTTYTVPMELFEETQENGRYLYMVPSIRRFSYCIYPWWDGSGTNYPVPGTFQYQFVTFGQTPFCRPMPLENFPFSITEPNETSLNQWKLSERENLYDAIYGYTLDPVVSLTWQSGANGTAEDLEVTNDTTTVTSATNSWAFEVKVGLNLDVPAIASNFDIQISTGTMGKITNETTTYSSYTNGISASLENLLSMNDGIKIGHLSVSAYMLDPKDAPYWYLDSCGGQSPWYLAWVVNLAYQSIILTSPGDNDRADSTGMIFSWEPDMGTLHDYEFLISKNPRVHGPTAIYHRKTGDETHILVSDFKPEPGVTYYWRVRGIDENKEFVWSKTRKIIAPTLPSERAIPEVKTAIYPNPGKCEEMKIMVSPEEDGILEVSLVNPEGMLVAKKSVAGSAHVPLTVMFEDTHLRPGIYLAVITSGDKRTIKKVILL